MTKDEKEILDCLDTLAEETKLTQFKGTDMDWVDWESQFGVLISVNEANFISQCLNRLLKMIGESKMNKGVEVEPAPKIDIESIKDKLSKVKVKK